MTNDGGCQAEHPGSLNFSAYRQGRDRQEPNEGAIPEAQWSDSQTGGGLIWVLSQGVSTHLGSASGFEIWAKCTFCILLHPFASFLQCKYVRPFSFLSWIHNLSSNGNAARMNEIHMFRNLFHPNLWSLSIEMETFRHFGCALRFPLWVLGCEWQELLRQAVGERLFQRPGETFDRRKRRCFV